MWTNYINYKLHDFINHTDSGCIKSSNSLWNNFQILEEKKWSSNHNTFTCNFGSAVLDTTFDSFFGYMSSAPRHCYYSTVGWTACSQHLYRTSSFLLCSFSLHVCMKHGWTFLSLFHYRSNLTLRSILTLSDGTRSLGVERDVAYTLIQKYSFSCVLCMHFKNGLYHVKKCVLSRTSKWVLLMHFQVALCGVVKMSKFVHGKSTHFLTYLRSTH